MYLYTTLNKLFIKINNQTFDVTSNDFTYDYFHGNNITTCRLNKLDTTLLELKYPSWMLSDNTPAGFGLNDDEDFLAYLKLFLDSNNTKTCFLNKYFT